MVSATNAASLAQNLITSTIQQMITQNFTDSLMNSASSGAANGAQVITPNIVLLKQNLLNAKVPYEIVNAVPLSKPMIGLDGKLMSFESNRYLVE